MVIQPPDCNDHAGRYTPLYKKFQKTFEKLIEEFIESVGGTVKEFYAELKEVRADMCPHSSPAP